MSSSWQTKKGESKHEGTHPVKKLYEYYNDREDVMIIPHQGGRAATLEAFDPKLSPLVEIISTWGVFEWFGQQALNEGYKIGFAGGSDDHTGRPGATYPTNQTGWNFNINGGLLAAYAESLTRDSIWEALNSKRCYATTGARIILKVFTNGRGMGSEVKTSKNPVIEVKAHGTSPLSRIDLFRASDLVSSVDVTEGNEILEFMWGGARSKNRNKVQDWSGGISIDKGKITSTEGFGFNHPQQGIIKNTDTSVKWSSASSGNYQGVRISLNTPKNAILSFSTTPITCNYQIKELAKEDKIELRGNPEKRLEVRRTGRASSLSANIKFKDKKAERGVHPYYVRVRQNDGEMAWRELTLKTCTTCTTKILLLS